MPSLSIIIPVYNSQDSLQELYSGLEKTLREITRDYEIIFVDDNSKDDSWSVLQQIKAGNPAPVRLIRLARNFGQHNATLCGITMARNDLIITIDDDLQTRPEDIAQLVSHYSATGCDVVYGIPKNKKSHSLVRNGGSKALKAASKSFRGTPGDGSSFRLMTKDIAAKLAAHQFHFVFLDEILLWYTDNIGFVQVEHLQRKYNESGYTVKKLLHLTANLVIFYTDAPLKIMVYGGFIASFLSFFLGLIYIVKKLLFNVPLGYTSLIVAILFSTSIILLSLGIIGEYLSRMYKVQNRKPPYSISRILD